MLVNSHHEKLMFPITIRFRQIYVTKHHYYWIGFIIMNFHTINIHMIHTHIMERFSDCKLSYLLAKDPSSYDIHRLLNR